MPLVQRVATQGPDCAANNSCLSFLVKFFRLVNLFNPRRLLTVATTESGVAHSLRSAVLTAERVSTGFNGFPRVTLGPVGRRCSLVWPRAQPTQGPSIDGWAQSRAVARALLLGAAGGGALGRRASRVFAPLRRRSLDTSGVLAGRALPYLREKGREPMGRACGATSPADGVSRRRGRRG